MSLTVVAFLVAGTAAKADAYSIAINMDAPLQSGAYGDVLSFKADLVNTGDNAVTLLGDDLTLTGLSATDDFYTNAPWTIDVSGTSGDILLFTVDIPNGTPFGAYSGVLDIFFGDSEYNPMGYAAEDFEIDITPEPGTWVLLATGLLLLAGLIRYRMPKPQPLTIA